MCACVLPVALFVSHAVEGGQVRAKELEDDVAADISGHCCGPFH